MSLVQSVNLLMNKKNPLELFGKYSFVEFTVCLFV